MYLLYDSDDGLFVKDTIAFIDTHHGREFFNMDWVREIRLERHKSLDKKRLNDFNEVKIEQKIIALKTISKN